MKRTWHYLSVIFLLGTIVALEAMLIPQSGKQAVRRTSSQTSSRLFATTPAMATKRKTTIPKNNAEKLKTTRAPKIKEPKTFDDSSNPTIASPPRKSSWLWRIFFGKPIEESRSELSDLIAMPTFDKNDVEQAITLVKEISSINPAYLNESGLLDEIVLTSFHPTMFSETQTNLIILANFVESRGGILNKPIASYIDRYENLVERLYPKLLHIKFNPKNSSALYRATKKLKSMENFFDSIDPFLRKFSQENSSLLEKLDRIQQKRKLLKQAFVAKKKLAAE